MGCTCICRSDATQPGLTYPWDSCVCVRKAVSWSVDKYASYYRDGGGNTSSPSRSGVASLELLRLCDNASEAARRFPGSAVTAKLVVRNASSPIDITIPVAPAASTSSTDRGATLARSSRTAERLPVADRVLSCSRSARQRPVRVLGLDPQGVEHAGLPAPPQDRRVSPHDVHS